MAETIGKMKLIKDIAAETGLSANSCEQVIDSFSNAIKNSMINGEKVILKNFLTFEIIERAERKGKDLKTGEAVIYPSVKSVKCKVSKAFKDAVNKE